jgi:hypothetical protein
LLKKPEDSPASDALPQLSPEELEPVLSQVLDHTIYLAKHAFQHVTLRTNGPQRFCIAPLVIKSMHKAHAINVLVKENLIEEAEIVLRILIEVSFVVVALAKDRTFVSQYARSAYVQKKRELQSWLRGDRELPTPILSIDQARELEAQLVKLSEAIKKLDAKPISIREYAERSGLLAIYFINYSRLSSSVHSGPEDIERFMKKDADRKLLSIGPPDPGRPDVLLWVAIETMTRILKAASDVFGLSIIGLNKVENFYRGMSTLMLTEMKII